MTPLGLTLAPRKAQPVIWLTLLVVLCSMARTVPRREPRVSHPNQGRVSQVGVARLSPCPAPAVLGPDNDREAVPLWSLAADGRPCVALFLSPGCNSCYVQVERLEALREAAAGRVSTILVVSSDWPYPELRSAGLRIAHERTYRGPLAIDPGGEAARVLEDQPPASPFALVVDEDRRLLALTRGYAPEAAKVLPLLLALQSPAAAREAVAPLLAPPSETKRIRAGLAWRDRSATAPEDRPALVLLGMELSPSSSRVLLEAASVATAGGIPVALAPMHGDGIGESEATVEGMGTAYGVPVTDDTTGLLRDMAQRVRSTGPWVIALPPSGTEAAQALVATPAEADEIWLLVELWCRAMRQGVR